MTEDIIEQLVDAAEAAGAEPSQIAAARLGLDCGEPIAAALDALSGLPRGTMIDTRVFVANLDDTGLTSGQRETFDRILAGLATPN